MRLALAFLFITSICGLVFPATVWSAAVPSVKEMEAAELQRLSQKNAWLRLLHFHTKWYGLGRSQVKDSNFFLDKQGYRDPQAELKATYYYLQKALASGQPLDEKQDVRCTYPARVDFIRRHLGEAIPSRSCPELDSWQEDMNPGSLTMVFPSAYMNNASSMFGHTLLRIDSRDRARNPDLIAWAVNFAAEVQEGDGGIAYALKGMFGLYPGYFSLMPYYEKVNEYSQLESRDIWEYPLNLTDEGLQRVIWHLWELDRIHFDYWFFDENCSYRLLALLSTAEDDLHLTQTFNIKALPVDTLRALDQSGLLNNEGNFRPSFATRLQKMSEQLTDEEIQLARTLVFEQPNPGEWLLPASVNQAGVYEFSAEWLNFRFQHQDLSREEAAPQLHRLLLARAGTKERAGFEAPKAPKVAPHKGHETARWGLGGGVQDDLGYISLLARPAYHSRFDDLKGYLPNAEINLFELEVRFFEEREKLEPWHLTLLEVGNYLPSSPVFSLAAWRVKAEVGRTEPLASSSDAWRSRLGGGYGRAWGDGRELMAYAFLAGELEAGPDAGYLNSGSSHDWAVGAGGNAGLVWSPVKPLRLGIDGRWIKFTNGNSGELRWAEATAQWNYSPNQSLRLQGQWEARGDESWQAGLIWLRFF